ncbi:MAG: hypothetical protein LBR25_05715 [Erysipelotrichaceae bacterium]|nr:hypothetical protein [Erysipelotrichaceae bacterium]
MIKNNTLYRMVFVVWAFLLMLGEVFIVLGLTNWFTPADSSLWSGMQTYYTAAFCAFAALVVWTPLLRRFDNKAALIAGFVLPVLVLVTCLTCGLIVFAILKDLKGVAISDYELFDRVIWPWILMQACIAGALFACVPLIKLTKKEKPVTEN